MTLCVRDVCNRYGVSVHTVLTWIGNGELKAVNVGRSLANKKPRWRVTAEALAAFEALRTPSPSLPTSRRRKPPTDITNIY